METNNDLPIGVVDWNELFLLDYAERSRHSKTKFPILPKVYRRKFEKGKHGAGKEKDTAGKVVFPG